ncbi:hypothetical protein LEP1GSC079_4783 [Leptospira interrogans str. FPW1039]|uniref:Uncharacterized protein n=1 Tax=Leptospira interrogans str. FPW1039 TaxID=1193040 RepID=A0A0F6IEH7_LEPIR|nr:hypothetical protein LEP1GSC079_4783 [Leptospira interrogans str. FPW1039]
MRLKEEDRKDFKKFELFFQFNFHRVFYNFLILSGDFVFYYLFLDGVLFMLYDI